MCSQRRYSAVIQVWGGVDLSVGFRWMQVVKKSVVCKHVKRDVPTPTDTYTYQDTFGMYRCLLV